MKHKPMSTHHPSEQRVFIYVFIFTKKNVEAILNNRTDVIIVLTNLSKWFLLRQQSCRQKYIKPILILFFFQIINSAIAPFLFLILAYFSFALSLNLAIIVMT
jgi:hypothetical protein